VADPRPELRACDMILMDSSPLIYLAKAGCLELLLHFSARVFVPDEVYFEAAGRWFGNEALPQATAPPADAVAIFKFISENADRFQIVSTQIGSMLAQQRRAGQAPKLDNAGEMAAVSVYERRRELTGDRLPVLVVFEDTEVPLRFSRKDAHLLSTFGLLVAMELAGHLPSAQQAFERIPAAERPSSLPVDVSVRGDSDYR
jgi:hypothetical protein